MEQLDLFERTAPPVVRLVNYTGMGRPDERWHAADVLIFTKATRLNMTPELFESIAAMPEQDKRAELDYMATTIPSSWEFVDVTFLISGVTRACAQQMTRTRQASYAMQSQRVTDLSDAAVTNPFLTHSVEGAAFKAATDDALDAYQELIALGATPQDARGILPMNVQCNLVAKYNLRAFVELVTARKSLRTQGEYADIVTQMERLVLEAWPWAAPFFQPKQEHILTILQRVADEIGVETGKGPGWQIAKAIDLLRKL